MLMMRPKFKTTLLAAFAATIAVSPLLVSNADAKKQPYLDFRILPSNFGTPTMVYNFKNGKYHWDGKTISTTFRLSARASTGKGWLPTLNMVAQSVHGSPKMFGKVPNDKKVIDHSDSITFNKKFLSAYAPNFASYCQKNGSIKRLVKDGFVAPFYVSMVDRKQVHFKDNVKMPIRVVCNPMPNPKRTNTDLKVTKLKMYTLPAKPKCGEHVKMVAEIHTNKPGKVNFRYFRGDGENRDGSVTTTKGGSGYVKRWATTYRFNENTFRKYKVVLMGHPKSTDWVPLRVKCKSHIGKKKS